jgi:hypothetical protein
MNKVDKNRPVSSIKHEDKRAAIGSDGTAFYGKFQTFFVI